VADGQRRKKEWGRIKVKDIGRTNKSGRRPGRSSGRKDDDEVVQKRKECVPYLPGT
jgi:hypothetical protein